jgi:phospholipid/cholesterol/gamma-HCH transport system permease protein
MINRTAENPVGKERILPPERSGEGSFYARLIRPLLLEITLLSRFCALFFRELLLPPYELKELVKQAYLIGYKSFPLVAITGFIMGLVLTIQSRPTLAQFGAESWLPAMVAVSIIREIGPVITALIFAGKAGSGIGAELASMKVTEQIDAMEVSGINPFKYLVVTRIIASTLMLPLLVIASDAVSLYGAYIGVNLEGDVSFRLFFLKVFEKLTFTDIFPAVLKTFSFGFIVALISCYKGYNSNTGTVGVGESANSSVVLASLSIFILDMIAVQITSLFT